MSVAVHRIGLGVLGMAFLQFMNSLVTGYQDQELHVILDNLNTHKPKRDLWLARHPNVHFHYTPTRASWLNQIEIWFSLLSRSALKHASFTSPTELRLALDRFIDACNDRAAPFEWKKQDIAARPLKDKYADLRKCALGDNDWRQKRPVPREWRPDLPSLPRRRVLTYSTSTTYKGRYQ